MTLAAPTLDHVDLRTPEILAAIEPDHERILITTGPRSGLTIIVAVHSTRLGQALGGARMWTYAHWTDALADALRLSQAMTLKNAAAGLLRGGGKAVIRVPVGTAVTPELKRQAMLDLGDAVASLGGAYMTAEDVGTSADLMAIVAERTEHVCGLPAEQGGVGEPADATAAGVHAGIVATVAELFGSESLDGRHFCIAGLGQVGGRLARSLARAGARLTLSDVVPSKRELADELGAAWVEPEDAHRVVADVFVPCGLGGVLTPETIAELRVRAVVGAANNQLSSRESAALLAERGILWAPDFVVNGGGVIYLDLASVPGADEALVGERVGAIGETLAGVYRESAARGITTLAAAERLAFARLDAAR
ncbi:Glu/Leu/Phe/Val dehydrogenase family protein [Agromyces atrinae]|uniref:Glu/Leu/Phe/Val dehydrogenase family protein n=1 Tax=Agromyces atrinae TaxID=592376 RepID=UPI001F5698F9|nr:Glu/Leu/Phe/Val dehydrogenase family protein [Agromyces atrinae]MCI2957895.1 Glu/Leu/Phe/Val dehydrogenase family protein [Agromyces atrinae]